MLLIHKHLYRHKLLQTIKKNKQTNKKHTRSRWNLKLSEQRQGGKDRPNRQTNKNNLDGERAWLERQSAGVLIETCDWSEFSCSYGHLRRRFFWGGRRKAAAKSQWWWVRKSASSKNRKREEEEGEETALWVKRGECWEGEQNSEFHHMHQKASHAECWLYGFWEKTACDV